ncbi:transcription factor BIM2-like [Chenopodium quinoa]|uniref:transcription factor BIM2-like n=1 Tax=Chenopodium quinoa TaxID=63459 RepID=UPI000B785F3C|nr:transcription factor BIM2-like [Chenopodium quinoa]
MKSSKGNSPEDDEEYDEDFTSKKEASSSNKDSKNNDKASAMRSKHSVTEQRRRSKINERFQILRDLIPHGDQKRDTASFLLEVIEYVQLLQEKVQKYEGPYQGWSTEPTKLMPWRHSHWRVQSFLGHPQAVKNGPGSASTFSGKFDERSFNSNPSVTANAQNPVDADSGHEAYRALDQQSELVEKTAPLPTPFSLHMPTVVQSDGDDSHLSQRPASDGLAAPCPNNCDDQQGEHTIEGGTINISNSYSHGLLMTLTQALQSSGVDLSQANISIRIDLGKRANQSQTPGLSGAKDLEISASHDLNMGHAGGESSMENLEQPQKKLKS